MRGWLTGISIALLACTALPLRAEKAEEAPIDGSRPGMYVAADGLYGFSVFGNGVSGGNSFGWGARAGYRANRYLALEGQIESPSGFDLRVDGAKVGKVDPLIWTVNARGYYPMGAFQPYGLVGVGMWMPGLDDENLVVGTAIAPGTGGFAEPGSNDYIDDRFAMKIGGGVDYNLTDAFAIGMNVIYTRPFADGDQANLSYVTVGWSLQYTFTFSEN